jgi:hypothetical protein
MPAFNLALLNSITEELINNILVNDILPLVVQDATKAVKDERKYDKINYLVQTRKPYQDQVSRSTKNIIEAVDSSFQNTNKKK